MIRSTRRSTRKDTLCTYTTLLRAGHQRAFSGAGCGRLNPLMVACVDLSRQGQRHVRASQRQGPSANMSHAKWATAMSIIASSHVSGSARCRDGLQTLSKDRMCMRSEEHTSELQSQMRISYAGFCLKNKIYVH